MAILDAKRRRVESPAAGNDARLIGGSYSTARQFPTAGSAVETTHAVERRSVSGLDWTFYSPFGRVLESIPAAAWANPAENGWRRVKQNSSRTVWYAQIEGAGYYLKYYVCKGWRAALKRKWWGPACALEWQRGVYAQKAEIPAVRPLAYAERLNCGGRVCSLLVSKAVEPAYPLHEFWQTLQADDDPTRQRGDTAYLIDLLAEMIARAHQAGFEHRDMHAANILVHPLAPGAYETVLVDLQNARVAAPLDDEAVVRNLAQLNQWFRRHSSVAQRLRFLRRYLRWRNEYEVAYEHGRPLGLSFRQLVHALINQADRHARRLWAKRDRRALRSGSYFSRLRIGLAWTAIVFLRCKRPVVGTRAENIVLDHDWWRQQLKDPGRWFDPAQGRPCKQSHSALVTHAVLRAGDCQLPVIIKRPRARNWRRRLRQLLAPSRSMRGWRVGNALINRDIPTARPLAVVERRVGPLVFDSFLLTEAVPGARDLEAHLRDEHARRSPAEWWRYKHELLTPLVRALRQLAERGFVHRDCKSQNLLIVARPALKAVWIDMDGLRHVGRPSLRQQLRALMRLHVSLLDTPGLTRSDRVRFLKAYFARFGSDPRAWRLVWGRLRRGAERKTRAGRTRRRWKLKHYGRP